ncbi:acyl-CoA dehydrogenase family protein [Zavarzinia sp. CC-PAN008]|uniref:acyl-CoA dehydrogenase family protein n=1 Tax=Zavarzinia sp. CC-PAN008 TaxID=3243332 RepID=UPI003F747380
MSDLETFRAETGAWLDANCPPEMRTPLRGEDNITWGGRNWVFRSEAEKVWLERMAAKGWTVPEWPKEYGGAGLSRDEAKVLREEMAKRKCRAPVESFGIWMLGPALLKYGSHEQKLEHLPRIARGEIRWCQGYSEPGAGSDLANLQTRAEDKGDHWLVNGSKIWTSYADKADWIFCLVRTNKDASKHEGISFLLFDMASEGVSTAPIKLISGNSPFCQTFFSDVKVPKGNLVGTLNKGWDIAKYLLTHERDTIGGGSGGMFVSRPLGQVAADTVGSKDGELADPLLRARIAELEVDAWSFALAVERGRDLAKAGQGLGAYSSVLKYYGAEINKRSLELAMDAQGADGLEWESERSNGGQLPRAWLRSKANSIEGGTNEVQLNIISKRILALPGA